MAELLSISLTYYSRVERGKNGLSLEKLVVLYNLFQIDLTYLITGKVQDKTALEQLLIRCPEQKKNGLERLIEIAIELTK